MGVAVGNEDQIHEQVWYWHSPGEVELDQAKVMRYQTN